MLKIIDFRQRFLISYNNLLQKPFNRTFNHFLTVDNKIVSYNLDACYEDKEEHKTLTEEQDEEVNDVKDGIKNKDNKNVNEQNFEEKSKINEDDEESSFQDWNEDNKQNNKDDQKKDFKKNEN